MRWQSALAIYVLFWTLSLFLVLPLEARTGEGAGAERVPGQAESAPHAFSLSRTALRATIVSAVLFGLFYLNYVNGWVSVADLDWAAPR